MLDVGRKIEQSLLVIAMLRSTLVNRHNEEVEYNLQQSVLMSNESLVNYRYKYRVPIQNRLVLDLLLFDPNNPRSLTYQVDRLKAYLKKLPKNQTGNSTTDYERLILEADELLKGAEMNELLTTDVNASTHNGLERFLSSMYSLLSEIPSFISKTYFKHELTSKTIISH